MTDREKLIEILRQPIFPHELVDPIEAVADYLLDNGVTIATDNNVGDKSSPTADWIPVTERLPDKDGISPVVIVYTMDGEVTTGWLDKHTRDTWFLVVGENDYHTEHERMYVTHWMPLPPAPEENK